MITVDKSPKVTLTSHDEERYDDEDVCGWVLDEIHGQLRSRTLSDYLSFSLHLTLYLSLSPSQSDYRSFFLRLTKHTRMLRTLNSTSLTVR